MSVELGFLLKCFALFSIIPTADAVCSRNELLQLQNSNLKFTEESRCRYDGSGVAQGICRGTLKCQIGYFSDVADEATLECVNGEWKKSAELNCEPGCKDFDISNATIVEGGLIAGKFWRKGHVVKTRCKSSYFFKSEKKRAFNTDQYKCLGEGNGWENLADPTDLGSWPGQCSRFCQLPEGIQFIVEPRKCDLLIHKGKRFLSVDSFFEVKGPNPKQIECADGYILNSRADRLPEPPTSADPNEEPNRLPNGFLARSDFSEIPAPNPNTIPSNSAIPNGMPAPVSVPNIPNGAEYPNNFPVAQPASLPNNPSLVNLNNPNYHQIPEDIRQQMQNQIEEEVNKIIGNNSKDEYQILQSQSVEELQDPHSLDGIDLSKIPDLPPEYQTGVGSGAQSGAQGSPQFHDGIHWSTQTSEFYPGSKTDQETQQIQGTLNQGAGIELYPTKGQTGSKEVIYQSPWMEEFYPAGATPQNSPHLMQNPDRDFGLQNGWNNEPNGFPQNGGFDSVYQNPTAEEFSPITREIPIDQTQIEELMPNEFNGLGSFPQRDSKSMHEYDNNRSPNYPRRIAAEEVVGPKFGQSWDYEIQSNSGGFGSDYPGDFESSDYDIDDFVSSQYSPNSRSQPNGRLSQIFFGRQPCGGQRSPNTIILQNPSGPILFGFDSIIKLDPQSNGFGRKFRRNGNLRRPLGDSGCGFEPNLQLQPLSPSQCQIGHSNVSSGCRVSVQCPQDTVLNLDGRSRDAQLSCELGRWHSDGNAREIGSLGCRKFCRLDLTTEVATEYSRHKCPGAEDGIFIEGCKIRLQCREGFAPIDENRQMEIIKCSQNAEWLNSSDQIATDYLQCRQLNAEDLSPYGYVPADKNPPQSLNGGIQTNNGYGVFPNGNYPYEVITDENELPQNGQIATAGEGFGPEVISNPGFATSQDGHQIKSDQISSGNSVGQTQIGQNGRNGGQTEQIFGNQNGIGEQIFSRNTTNPNGNYNYTIIETTNQFIPQEEVVQRDGQTIEQIIPRIGEEIIFENGNVGRVGENGIVIQKRGHNGFGFQPNDEIFGTGQNQQSLTPDGNVVSSNSQSQTSGLGFQPFHSDQTVNQSGIFGTEGKNNGQITSLGNENSANNQMVDNTETVWSNTTQSQQSSNQSYSQSNTESEETNTQNGHSEIGHEQQSQQNSGLIGMTTNMSLSATTTAAPANLTCRPLDLIDGRAIDVSNVNCHLEKDYYYSPGCDVAVLCVYGWIPVDPNVERIPLKCDPATGQIRNVQGKVFKDSDFACRQVFISGCQAIARKEGVLFELEGNATVDATPSVVDGSLRSGVRAHIHCDEGFFPDAERYQRSGAQNLTCGEDFQWRDVESGELVEQTLVCAKGCIARPTLPPTNMEEEQTISKKFRIDKLSIHCEKRMSNHDSQVEFDGPDRPYYCKAGQKPKASGSETRSIPCTNACRSLAEDPDSESISVNQTALKKKIRFDGITYVPDGHIYTFNCKKPNETFPLQSRSAMRLQCIGKDRNYMDLDTKEQHFKIVPRCETPKKKGTSKKQPADQKAPALGKEINF